MKILVTGGTGFVGHHVQEELAQRNVPFFAFGRRQFDLTRWEQAEAVFKAHADADLILHLASFQAAGEFPAKHTAEQFFINNLIHNHTLEAWRKFIPRARLVATLAGSLAKVSRPDVIERSIAHFRQADPDYGARVAEAVAALRR